MPVKRRRTPQEKKRISYAKDHRNSYGESDKASRKTIPLRKKKANRAVRKAGRHLLTEDPEAANNAYKRKHQRRWRKLPDTRLGQIVPNKLLSRADRVFARQRRHAITEDG